MESRNIEVNGIEITCYADGSIEKPYFNTTTRTFGSIGNGYRLTQIGSKKMYIHRLMAQAFLGGWDESLQVDHINNNGLDNTIGNLRLSTKTFNATAGRKVAAGKTSKFMGVYFRKDRGKYQSQLFVTNDKKISLGCYFSEEEAALAYDAEAIKQGWPKEGLNQYRYPELLSL